VEHSSVSRAWLAFVAESRLHTLHSEVNKLQDMKLKNLEAILTDMITSRTDVLNNKVGDELDRVLDQLNTIAEVCVCVEERGGTHRHAVCPSCMKLAWVPSISAC
jgi:hypothetical protein